MFQVGWLLLVLFYPLSALGEIYKSIGPEGQVIYSDRAAPGAEEIRLDPVQTYSPPRLPNTLDPDPQVASSPEPDYYEGFSVEQPGDNETIWDNQGNVSVVLNLQPDLRPGDEIQVLLDDHHVIAQGHTPIFHLQNMDRGTHRLQGVIIDASGRQVARTPSITFYLRRTIVRRPSS